MGKKPVFFNVIILSIIFISLFCARTVYAQEEGEQQQEYDTKNVIYYVFLDSKDKYQIGVMGLKGEDKKILTADGNNWCPAVSNNGDSVAFYSDRSGNTNLWSMNTDGSGIRQLTDNKEDIVRIDLFNRGQISWKKEDKEIFFLSGGNIWQVDRTGETPSALTKYHDITSFKLNPENSKILYSREKTRWRNGLFTMLLDGTNERQVAPSEILYPSFDWGDNLRIAYFSNPGIYTVSSFGVSKKYLLEVNWQQNDIAWCRLPDGKSGEIAFISDKSGKPQIWAMNDVGKELKQITVNGGFSQVWFPDGKELAYVEENDIYRINLETKEKFRLTYYFKSYFPVIAGIRVKKKPESKPAGSGEAHEE